MICRTVEEIREAARRDAADDPPLTRRQVEQLAALLRPYLVAGPEPEEAA